MVRRRTGEGSIYKRGRDGLWVGAITVGWEGGKRRRLSHASAKRREVSEWLAARQAERGAGLLNPDRQSVAQFLDHWLRDTVAPSLAPRTLDQYERVIRLHVNPAIGAVALSKLSPQHLARLYRLKREEGLTRTVEQIRAILRSALERAVEWGLLSRNPARTAKLAGVRRTERKVLTVDQVAAFLAVAREDRLFALYVLAITTGLRQGELLGLHWEDIDAQNATLRVGRSLSWNKGAFSFAPPKTPQSRRIVALVPQAVEALERHRANQTQEQLRLAGAWNDPRLVFSTRIGSPISRSNLIRRSFAPLREKAGLTGFTFHQLRHTTASLLLADGENPKAVQELLGHARVTTTLGLYVHTLPGSRRQVAHRMAKLLSKPPEPPGG